jgi:hypothetical protein
MIKMVTTRASLLLTCSATSISSTSTALIRLSDGQIVSGGRGLGRCHNPRVGQFLMRPPGFVIKSPLMLSPE